MGEETIIVAPDMTPAEREMYARGYTESYLGFVLAPKCDFGPHGYWSNEHRCNINAGWVALYGSGEYAGALATPGATWAPTLQGIRDVVDAMVAAGYSGHSSRGDGEKFWTLYHSRAMEA